jgi:hypothetical protein
MLLPNQCDAAWTDLTRVLSDQVPMAAGLGAMETAQQALGLSPADAANLVASGGTLLTAPQLAKSAGSQTRRSVGKATRATRVPIPNNVDTAIPLVNGDENRTFILIQNNNASGGANLLISVDGMIDSTNPQFYLNLQPTFGILLDEEVFGNPIFVAWGSGTIAGGMIMYGSSAAPPVTLQMAPQVQSRYTQ